ncbi:MAG: hypothetical protein ACOX0G_00600 [Patescibacteria group bacterium]
MRTLWVGTVDDDCACDASGPSPCATLCTGGEAFSDIANPSSIMPK